MYILPRAYPPHAVSGCIPSPQEANPKRIVCIKGEPADFSLFCDSHDVNYVEIPLENNPRAAALVYNSCKYDRLQEFMNTDIEEEQREMETIFISNPSSSFRVLYRSTGIGPGTKHMIFSAYYFAEIIRFLEAYLATPGTLLAALKEYERDPVAYKIEFFPWSTRPTLDPADFN